MIIEALRGQRRIAAGIGLLAFLAPACAARQTAEPSWPAGAEPSQGVAAPPSPGVAPPYEQGVASYYSDKLAGRRTAGGEPYDPSALTAAHRTLPFGTIVQVDRVDGRSVRVRINDRGPFVSGRVVDLSRRAAESIGMIADGIADVWLRVVYVPPAKQARRRR